MIIKKYSLAESLNKAYLKQDIGEAEFIRFKNSLYTFLQSIKHDESEEYQKNTIAEFLRNAFYKDKNLINTSDRIDLAIYNGIEKDSPVSVLVEVKRTSNKSEMFSFAKPNVKAFHEILSYYLEQSFTLHNKEIKHLIITNTEDWFIFDGAEFEKTFYKNNHVTKKFSEHRNELFGANTTQWFYNYLRDEILPEIGELGCTYFSINDFNNFENEPQKEEELIELFKILSPEHLLKKPFANDSNTLDSQFYDELLHLLGLEETKEAGKKVLLRLSPEKRNAGSLLENTIHHLKQKNALDNINNIQDYGSDEEEQYFSIGLELCITWLNRILFLKLLESQLIKYHNNFDYKFLSSEKVLEFDDLNELFFDVLALKLQDREQGNKEKFKNIPYLNSSLFDMTLLERKTIIISNLKDKYDIPVYAKTVLKTISGEKISGWLKLHKYILDFLDAYNFSSDRKATVQPINKTIINSSVLGLIFEKLNGYKDGSYFTPSYITMYMCREAITKAVIEKFNTQYKWNCNSLDDIYNRIDTSVEKLKEYNNLINSIRLVDPAVGSGHFLVSALNEFIYIKSELGILIDSNGKRLRDLKFYIENDELIIVDNDDKIFSYLSPEIVAGAKRDELQRVQKTIFQEKQTIIENCLFGVDINPKSVAIACLRLWIELLKSAYYKLNESNNWELEVLPNIDINIKCGNSLISKYDFDSNLTLGDKSIFREYVIAVATYKNLSNREDKLNIKKVIEKCKLRFKGNFEGKSNDEITLGKLANILQDLLNQTREFITDSEKVKLNKKKEKLENQINVLRKKVNEDKLNKLNSNSIEWRFEFPEVLDDDGNFIGFDVVIGNPPYLNFKMYSVAERGIFKNQFNEIFDGKADIYYYFFLQGLRVVRQNGIINYITSRYWLEAEFAEKLRKILANSYSIKEIIDFKNVTIFEGIGIKTATAIFQNTEPKIGDTFQYKFIESKKIQEINISEFTSQLVKNDEIKIKSKWVFGEENELSIYKKIEKDTILLESIADCKQGILTGFDNAFVISNEINLDLEIETLKPWLKVGDIFKFYFNIREKRSVIYPNEIKNIEDYPKLMNHLQKFKSRLENREEALRGNYRWFDLHRPRKSELFNSPKLICRYKASQNTFALDLNKYYSSADTTIVVLKENYVNDFDLKFILALVNSKLLDFYFKSYGKLMDYRFEYYPGPVGKLRIKNAKNQNDFIKIVNKIIELKSIDYQTDTTAEEKQIDRLVYQLYDLSEDEIKVVEGEK